jgi:uncharacterized protein (DUF1684 family)
VSDAVPALADWRLRVAELYLTPPIEGEEGWEEFRRGRDALFREHPQAPLTEEQRAAFRGLPYFRYRAEAVVSCRLEPPDDDGPLEIDTGGEDGVVRYRRVGRLHTSYGALTLFWIEGYGGGLFLPFRDATAGAESYGGGRYLTDTVKGTFGRGVTLAADSGDATLDFNYSYNPSCAYNSRWACPLAPPENRLSEKVAAGERVFPTPV